MKGVVDVEIETEEGQVVGVGEVKGSGEGRYQLLAAMQAYRDRDGGKWPVGFVTSAGVYPATRMRYCSGDAHPLLRMQSGSPEVSVTYQKVDHRKSFHVIAMCLY